MQWRAAYTGPFVVTAVETTGGSSPRPTGFCTVQLLRANDTRGPSKVVRFNRLWPFDASRTTADHEHQLRLPPDYIVVKAIVGHGEEGSGQEGMFLVSYLGREESYWQPHTDLLGNELYAQYCKEHGLTPSTGMQSGAGPRPGERPKAGIASARGNSSSGRGAEGATTQLAETARTPPTQTTAYQLYAVDDFVSAREFVDAAQSYPAFIVEVLPRDFYRVWWSTGQAGGTRREKDMVVLHASCISPLKAGRPKRR